MRLARVVQTPEQEAYLLRSPNNDWKWGGIELLGGTVILGDSVDLLKAATKGKKPDHVRATINARLGTLLFTSLGLGNTEISKAVECNERSISGAIEDLKIILNASERAMILPSAVRNNILTVDTFGQAANLRFSRKLQVKLGLLSTVPRDWVVEALGVNATSIGAGISHFSEGKPIRSSVCSFITAAMVTHQIGVSGIPLTESDDHASGVRPMVSLDAWNEMVQAETSNDFVAHFRALQLDHI